LLSLKRVRVRAGAARARLVSVRLGGAVVMVSVRRKRGFTVVVLKGLGSLARARRAGQCRGRRGVGRACRVVVSVNFGRAAVVPPRHPRRCVSD